MDPQNNRLSVFDTAGTYLEGKHAPGGFGRLGRDYAPVPMHVSDEFRLPLVAYDRSLTPIDTLRGTRDPVRREGFVKRDGDGFISAGVPFQGRLQWQLSPTGTIWATITDQYRLFELAPDGDTLRTITRAFTPLPVTAADGEQAREGLKWYTDQGGQVDWSRLPDHKSATRSFFIDDEDNLSVEIIVSAEDQGRVLDVFDAQGRYLGAVRLPFALTPASRPIIRDGLLYAVTGDELEVQYLVRARIVKPGA